MLEWVNWSVMIHRKNVWSEEGRVGLEVDGLKESELEIGVSGK